MRKKQYHFPQCHYLNDIALDADYLILGELRRISHKLERAQQLQKEGQSLIILDGDTFIFRRYVRNVFFVAIDTVSGIIAANQKGGGTIPNRNIASSGEYPVKMAIGC